MQFQDEEKKVYLDFLDCFQVHAIRAMMPAHQTFIKRLKDGVAIIRLPLKLIFVSSRVLSSK